MIKYRVYKRDPSLIHNKDVYYISIINKEELFKYNKQSKTVNIFTNISLCIFIDKIYNIDYPIFIENLELDTRLYTVIDYKEVMCLINMFSYNIRDVEIYNEIINILKNILLFWDDWYD